MKKHYSIFFALTALMLLVFTACNEDSSLNQPLKDPQSLSFYGKQSKNCINFRIDPSVIDIGCACISAPMACPPGGDEWCNFGAKPKLTQIGEYSGYLSSIATGVEQMGNNGALQITLIHYFESLDGQSAFWTEDQAVCAPGSGANSCVVNDVLDIVGGCGIFEGATGKFHNNAVLSFDGGAEPCNIFYLGGQLENVPTGSLEALNFHGRICLEEE